MANGVTHKRGLQIIRMLGVDRDYPEHMEYFEQHDDGLGRLQDLRAADGERSDLTGCGVRAPRIDSRSV
jgi:hypothetical protein